MKAHICQSPVYDPNSQKDSWYHESQAYLDFDQIDDQREIKNEGVSPGLGSFHMYHRINSKLVAVGEFDLTNKRMVSKYFMYDPDYKFLSLGVLGRIHEIEFCKMLKRRFHPFLEFYILGDYSINCPKLAQKARF
jgi:Putative arginyl-tRNA:protein arginylyltransferase